MAETRASQLQESIDVIEFIIKKRKRKNAEMAEKMTLNENQKLFLNSDNELIKHVELLVKNARRTYGDIIGKMPPHFKELEEKVLGAALLEKPAFDKIKSFLLPEHFYEHSHQKIYAALLKVPHEIPYAQAVIIELRKTGHLEEVGGIHAIVELTAKVSSSAAIEYDARVLIEMAIKRRLILSCASIMSDAYEDSADCFDLLESLENEIKAIKSWIK